ncbi:Fur family transcriptional regulator [Spirillospora sp. NPDC046719]
MPQTPRKPRRPGAPATPRQKLVIEALDRSAEPRSANELHADLRAHGEKVGLTTVYRALAALDRAGLVHAFEQGGETVYLGCGGGSHVHLVCRVCGLVLEIEPARIQDRLDGRPATAAFRVEQVYGVCGECRTDAPSSC